MPRYLKILMVFFAGYTHQILTQYGLFYPWLLHKNSSGKVIIESLIFIFMYSLHFSLTSGIRDLEYRRTGLLYDKHVILCDEMVCCNIHDTSMDVVMKYCFSN
jgi:hypothetical protein